jgi:hypothetical protein
VPKLTFALLISAVAGGAALAIAACGSSAADSSPSPFFDGSDPDGSDDGATGPFADAGGIEIAVNGIVLVHAASFPAFRICFEGALEERPLPSTDVMPESNVVGVDVGTAVRLPPHAGTLGRAFVFPERSLRALYPAFGGSGIGPTCGQLLLSNKPDAIEVGNITSDVSSGVHAFVLQGCRSAALDSQSSTARCGDDWTAGDGNLRLRVLELKAYARPGNMAGLPVQIVQLSPALARMSAGRALGVAFGALDREGGAAPAPFIEGDVPFGTPVPNPPALLDYAAADLQSYATTGVFVTMGGAVDDAGAVVDGGPDAAPREIVIMQSLEDIQRRSASRSLPQDWFAVASSYVVVSVGEPDPRLSDGGPDDDERRALHLLAIPLAAPDGGTDGGR